LYPIILELVSIYCVTAADNTVVHASCHDMSFTQHTQDRSAGTVRAMSGNVLTAVTLITIMNDIS